MAAKKKKTTVRKKTAPTRSSAAPARRVSPASPSAPSAVETTLKQIEERLGALEAKVSTPTDLGRELRAVIQPAVDTYRESVRLRGNLGIQMPFVLAGIIGTVLIIVTVLAFNDVLSGDAAAILLGGTLLYAIVQFRKLITG